LLIRQGPQQDEVLKLLERAADKGHPHAVALLYTIYQQPFLVDEQQPEKAESYRRAYAQLDVAQSGYPSFEKALELVSHLIEPPPLEERPAPCPSHCR
jgi:TPR repeat protein